MTGSVSERQQVSVSGQNKYCWEQQWAGTHFRLEWRQLKQRGAEVNERCKVSGNPRMCCLSQMKLLLQTFEKSMENKRPPELEELSFSSPTAPTAAHSEQLKKRTPLAEIKQLFTCNERQSCRFATWKTAAYKNRLCYSWDKTLTDSLVPAHSSVCWAWATRETWVEWERTNLRGSYMLVKTPDCLTLPSQEERETYYSGRMKVTHRKGHPIHPGEVSQANQQNPYGYWAGIDPEISYHRQ